jgi:G:T/U-mismatch repair DNA glycosylase
VDDGGDNIIRIYNSYLKRHPKTEKDIDFYYGSEKNYFWKLFADLHETTLPDLKSIKNLLTATDTAITDIFEICIRKLYDKQRKKLVLPSVALSKNYDTNLAVSSGDSSLYPLRLRDIPAILKDNRGIECLIFTSNLVASLFRKNYTISDHFGRNGDTYLTPDRRKIKIVLIPSPSGAANISIGNKAEYRKRREADPQYNTYQYRLEIYQKVLVG